MMMEQAEDRILETYINNLSEGASEVIHGHLRDLGFLYAAHMPKRTKLDPPLISVLVRDGDRRRTRSISPATSVQLHSKMLIYKLVYWLMGMSLRGQLLVSIGVQHASNYWGRCQTGLRCILPQPQELNDLNMIDMRGRLDEDWATFRKKYIEIWQHMYNYLPTRKPFLTPELATTLDYMD
ncbi:hypothetical protein CXB51_017324 [Gossypium anomalum]|uniref:Uncharacterized protein n=1 Tax=Gossypium anomalum TaxID=47600 RepID=A0A8J6CZG6_9ROSI|nr:hypothetical protein CXB51_017324 [Gossypium anomalum]